MRPRCDSQRYGLASDFSARLRTKQVERCQIDGDIEQSLEFVAERCKIDDVVSRLEGDEKIDIARRWRTSRYGAKDAHVTRAVPFRGLEDRLAMGLDEVGQTGPLLLDELQFDIEAARTQHPPKRREFWLGNTAFCAVHVWLRCPGSSSYLGLGEAGPPARLAEKIGRMHGDTEYTTEGIVESRHGCSRHGLEQVACPSSALTLR